MIINDFNRIFPTTFPPSIPQKYNQYCDLINKCIFENGYNRIVNPRYENDILNQTRQWCDIMSYNITRLLDTITLEYNPIHNYDGNEKITFETAQYSDKTTTGERQTVVNNDPVTDKTTTDAQKVESLNKVNAFNTASMTDDNKTTTNTDAFAVTLINGARKESTKSNEYDVTNTNGARKETTTIEKGGNLGITTTQQMLSAEYLLLQKFNQITIITNMWFDAFTIGFE